MSRPIRHLLACDIEKLFAAMAFGWGIWVLMWQPMSSAAPTVRGFYLLNEIFSGWLPFASDYVWGCLAAIPASLQIYYLAKKRGPTHRRMACVMLSALFGFIAILIALANFKSPGVVMYGGFAFGFLIRYAQITFFLFHENL